MVPYMKRDSGNLIITGMNSAFFGGIKHLLKLRPTYYALFRFLNAQKHTIVARSSDVPAWSAPCSQSYCLRVQMHFSKDSVGTAFRRIERRLLRADDAAEVKTQDTYCGVKTRKDKGANKGSPEAETCPTRVIVVPLRRRSQFFTYPPLSCASLPHLLHTC